MTDELIGFDDLWAAFDRQSKELDFHIRMSEGAQGAGMDAMLVDRGIDPQGFREFIPSFVEFFPYPSVLLAAGFGLGLFIGSETKEEADA